MPANPEEQRQLAALTALAGNKWHAMETAKVLETLGSRPGGLSKAEAEAALQRYGPNSTPDTERPGIFWRIFAQLYNSVIFILIAAAIVSAVFADWPDLGLIVAVIVLNATIGVVQEGKAEAAAEALNKMMDPNATVIRDGGQVVIKSDAVVIGDIVVIQAGDRIPADLRLITASNLKLSESALTGESEDVLKSASDLVPPEKQLGDQINRAFAGTSVSTGSGTGVVVGVGPIAEIGHIKSMINKATATETPLQQQLEVFGRVLSILTILVAIATFFIAWKARDNALAESFAIAVSIAVAIIPEGLPSVVTITLALGVRKMAEHNAIVRQLPAVETLGSVAVVCSDKTGTLTLNQMMVTRIRTSTAQYTVEGNGYDPYSGEVQGAQGSVRKKEPALLDQLRWLCLPGVVANDGGLMSPSTLAAMWPSKRNVGGAGAAAAGTGSGSARRVDSRPASVLTPAEKAAIDSDTGNGTGATETWKIAGDPTDVAVLVLGHKLGITGNINNYVRTTFDEISKVPFDSDYKFVAVLTDITAPSGGRKRVVYIKGAWDEVIRRCGTQASGNDAFTSAPIDRDFWLAEASGYAANGMRVLAVAQWEVPADKTTITVEEIRDAALASPCLQLNCLVSIVDPCRESATRAVAECHAAGIIVKMITGDHGDTAAYISKELGIIDNETFQRYLAVKDTDPEARKHIVLRGEEIKDIPSDDKESHLAKYVMDVNVFARVAPEHKLRIVRALKESHGKITSMTGDGVNDAPALKEAHVGVAMGITGTEVAKSAAKIVLSDDLFATISEAVRRGRGVYDNLRKILLFGLPTSFAQGFCIVVAMIIGQPNPLTAMQVLTVNMATSVSLATVVALEEPEADVMRRPPRDPKASLLDGLIAWRSFFVTALLIVAMLGNYQWDIVDGGTPATARAMAMTTLVTAQCLYTLSCRFVTNSSLTYRVLQGNPWLIAAIIGNMALQMFFIYTPAVNTVWGMEPIAGAQWGKILLLSFAIFLIVEAEKALWPRVIAPCIKALAPLGNALACRCACCHTVAMRVLCPASSTAATGTPAPSLAVSNPPTTVDVGKSAGAAAAATGTGSGKVVSLAGTGVGTGTVSSEYARELALSRDVRSSRHIRHAVVPSDPAVARAITLTKSNRNLVLPAAAAGAALGGGHAMPASALAAGPATTAPAPFTVHVESASSSTSGGAGAATGGNHHHLAAIPEGGKAPLLASSA